VLWRELEGRQILGYEFDRAYAIQRDRVAFYCEALRLAVDVERIISKDVRALHSANRRSSRLARLGVQVLRFTDDEVMHNLDGVVANIRRWVRGNPQHWGAAVKPHRRSLPAGVARTVRMPTRQRRRSTRARP
jgi:very-short-patch-repair endonuclease